MAEFEEEEYDIIPSGVIPGQVGKVLTILALPQEGSFTDPDHEALLTKINCDDEDDAGKPVFIKRRRFSFSRNAVVCLSLWIAYTLINIAYSTINPFFPQIAKKKGVEAIVIGVIISSSPFCVVVLSPFIGYFLPYFAIWLQFFVGMILVGLSYIALAFVNLIASKWVFIVLCVFLRTVEGFGSAVLITAIFSTFPKLYPKAVGTLVGLFELAGGFGYAVGPSLGGVMFQYQGYRFPFLVIGGLVVAFVLPCTLLISKLSVDYEKKTVPSRIIFRLFTDGLFVTLVVVVALGYNITSYLAPTLPVYLKEEFNQTPIQIGLLYCVSAIAYLVVALPIGPLVDKVGYHRVIVVIGLLFVAVPFLLLGLINYTDNRSIWTIRITYACFSTGSAICIVPIYPDLLKIGQKYLRPGESKAAFSSFVSGVITSAGCLSLVIGPVIGGALETVLPVPVCSVILGEAMGALALIVMGMSLINRCTARTHEIE